jgi:hypothetical protein
MHYSLLKTDDMFKWSQCEHSHIMHCTTYQQISVKYVLNSQALRAGTFTTEEINAHIIFFFPASSRPERPVTI